MDTPILLPLFFYGILRPALFLAGALLLVAVLRRRPAALKHSVLVMAFAVVSVFPLLMLGLPVFPLISGIAPEFPVVLDSGTTDVEFLATDVNVAEAAVEDRVQITGMWILFWGGGSACLLARLVASAVSLRRSCGKQVEPGVFLSEAERAPLTFGVFRPRILLPMDSEGWAPGLRETVLAHERCHVSRYDALSGLLAEVVCALYWPNPLVWLAKARLVREREQACDDAVLARGVPPVEYAKALVAVASGRMQSLALGMADVRMVEARVRGILDPLKQRDLSVSGKLLGCLALLVLAFPVVTLRAENPGAKPRFSTVVIDAGHGGMDSGNGSEEKELVLALALGLEKRLKAGGVEVVMTRSDDTYIQLRDRVKVATEAGDGAILVSLHSNASTNRAAHGVETYISAASGKETALGIENRLLANYLQRDLSALKDMEDLGVKSARFLVLRSLQIPGVMVNCGFLSNPEERGRLMSDQYRESIIAALGNGLMAYRDS